MPILHAFFLKMLNTHLMKSGIIIVKAFFFCYKNIMYVYVMFFYFIFLVWKSWGALFKKKELLSKYEWSMLAKRSVKHLKSKVENICRVCIKKKKHWKNLLSQMAVIFTKKTLLIIYNLFLSNSLIHHERYFP